MKRNYLWKITSVAFLIGSLCMPLPLFADDEDEVDEDVEAASDTLTIDYANRLDSLWGRGPVTFTGVENFQSATIYNANYHHEQVYVTGSNDKRINVLILVKSPLYKALSSEIKQYADDIYSRVGYTSATEIVDNENFYRVKQLICSYQNANLVGAVLVGDFAYARYEHIEKVHQRNTLVNWPCDLYYMDLDGVWYDNDGNGIFDERKGKVGPEIFVARISAKNFPKLGSESVLLAQYFQKDHLFWTGNGTQYSNALAYTSHDWSGFTDFWKRGIRYLYGANAYTRLDETIYNSFGKADYLYQIQHNYGLIQLAAHSDPFHHCLTNNIGSVDTLLYATQLLSRSSGALCYNLFCCSALDWTRALQNDFLGGSYLYNTNTTNNTLTVVGSTKTGSMLKFRHFYKKLANNATVGDAFVHWFNSTTGTRHDDYDISWFYGMTILGDPCITLLGKNSHKVTPFANLGDGTNPLTTCYSVDGHLIFEKGSEEQVNGLPSGVYILQQICNGQVVNVKKVVK